jgi:Zn-dependent peptidase ImmA (M78 family)
MSGILVALEDAPLIAYNGSHPTGRQRFTIAHELGHLVLGHLDELHVDVSAREGSDERPGYDSAQEKAANEFAANLLMPAPWVKARASAGEPPDHMAGLFQVSDLALGYRFMSLGIKPEDS